MRKSNIFCLAIGIVLILTSCKGVLETKPKVNIDNVPWEVKMGVNYLDDRSAMVAFTNNADYTITEIDLEFRMKQNIQEEKLDEFYSYLEKEYSIIEKEDIEEIRETGLSMHSHVYLDEDEYIKKGQTVEEELCYGYVFIETLDYYDLFEPDMYRIEYIDENGEEHITYYDYVNKTYSEK